MSEPNATVASGPCAALARVVVGVAGAALIAMVAIQAWQVFARYVLNDAPSWTEPLALLCMSTTMMFGAAAGVHSGRHFGFFILVEHAAPSVRRVMLVMAHAIAAAMGAMLAVWGGQMMIEAWDYEIAGAALPQGLVFLPLCFGGALIAVFAIEKLVRSAPAKT
jgi:TRAP-type C4-dicarboxylate transport system permease small subunit